MNKQQLAAKIWESANQMRSKIEANEYKDYILGFIFYKYLSDNLERLAASRDFSKEDIQNLSEDDKEVVNFFKNNLGYFIAHKHLFSTWLALGGDFQVSDVRDALSAFSRLINPDHKRLFEGIFKTLETGLSKLGESAAKQTKAISELIQLIKDIPMDGRQGYDVLGFIYEYLIGMFAANAGKKAGEFYTPHEVSVLMSEIIAHHVKDKETIQIYDSTSGSGSLLLNIGQSIAKHMVDKDNIKYYAQELKENTYNLTRMNLVMRGILPTNIVTRNADTLEDDWPFFDDQDPVNTYNPLYLDAVVSNPPYSQKWDPQHKDSDPRYARFGLAPKSKADYAFLLHDLYHLKPDGIMAIVLPHGVLFRGGEEGTIRRNLIENNHLETIIGLPPNIFFGTGIPTIILVLRQKRESSDVLIVDASKGFAKEGKNNKLRACDIKKIADTVIGRVTVPRYSRLVPKTELQANDYNLNIPRYVDSSEPAESWDLYASMFGGIPLGELDALADFWKAFPGLRAALFADNGTPYVAPLVEDLAEATRDHPEVKSYGKTFTAAFADFTPWLRHALLEQMLTLQIPRQESLLSEELFARLAPLPLIDKYHAYQILDDHWQAIAIDLEILHTEGFDASRVVDPNLVTKKKDGKDVEVQEGWKGRILPFELVQMTHHKKELDALREKENRLSGITATLEEILESLSEEDKANDTVNDDGDKFVNAAVAKEAKLLLAEAKQSGNFDPESYEAKIIQAADWLAKEKTLKAAIKQEATALHLKTKKTIEGLSDAQVHELLERKWITPLHDELHRLPDQQIDGLTRKLEALAQNYQITYADNARDIQQTETELAGMIEELDANEFDLKGLCELKTLLTENDMTAQTDKNMPQIRFKGFFAKWAEKKLGEVLTERNVLHKITEDTPILAFAAGQGVIPRSERRTNNRDHLTRDQANKFYKLTEYDDLVYNPANLKYGAIDRNKRGRGVISPIYVTFTTKQVPCFIELIIKSEKFKLKALLYEEGTVVKRQSVSPENLLSLDICITINPEEQVQIGKYFRGVDRLIGLHQRKHNKLVTLKKAMLQKMFPQPGATTPEIRFKGFSEPWEEKALAEVAYVFDGTHQTPQYTTEGVMFLSVENIHSLRSDKFISKEAFNNEFKIFPQEGDVLMTRIGDIGTANVVESTEPIAYYVSLALLKLKSADPYFIKNCISSDSVIKALFHLTLHIAFPIKINKNEIEKVEILLPKSKQEQQKIGTYFRTLDKLIAKHATQLQKLQQIKSACLEKMFV